MIRRNCQWWQFMTQFWPICLRHGPKLHESKGTVSPDFLPTVSFGHNNLPGLFIKHCLTKFSFSTNIYAKNLCASKLIYIYIYDSNICKNKTFSKTKIRVLGLVVFADIFAKTYISRNETTKTRNDVRFPSELTWSKNGTTLVPTILVRRNKIQYI